MKTRHHLQMSIAGALNQHPRDFHQSFKGVVTDDDGRVVSPETFRNELLRLQAKGHTLFPMASECEGFDPFEKGCPGHPVYEWTQA